MIKLELGDDRGQIIFTGVRTALHLFRKCSDEFFFQIKGMCKAEKIPSLVRMVYMWDMYGLSHTFDMWSSRAWWDHLLVLR